MMVEKGDGGSFRCELGLRRVARASLGHADEGAPGRLVQQGTVGEITLVENLPPLVDRRRTPHTDRARCMAMTELGNGLYLVGQYAEKLSVAQANLSTVRRLGASEDYYEDALSVREADGASNPFAGLIGQSREEASAALRARETPSA